MRDEHDETINIDKISLTTPQLREWSAAALYYCGRANYLLRLLSMCRYGLAELKKDRKDRFCFQVTNDQGEYADLEAHRWFDSAVREGYAIRQASQPETDNWVHERLEKYVGLVEDHYIRYESDIELEEYFTDRAAEMAAAWPEHDMFPDDATFGGQPFSMYRRLGLIEVGRALKHIAFCWTLKSRHPEVVLDDIYTQCFPLNRLEDERALALGLEPNEVRQLMEIYTLDRSKLADFNRRNEIPAGLYLRLCQTHRLLPLQAALANPFPFMARELRRLYSKDWDRAVDGREKLFRDELRHIFGEPKFHVMPSQCKIRAGGDQIRTDIDAVVLDRTTGALGLFQLKWQDPFGKSLKERDSKRKNLEREASRWVPAMTDWIAGRGARDVARDLGLRSDRDGPVLLFFLGRNAIRFTNEAELDPRVAWGTWHQLLRMRFERQICGNLEDYWRGLQQEHENRVIVRPPRRTINFLGLKVIVAPMV
ncbi:hypothetical protein [Azospirillum palustre]